MGEAKIFDDPERYKNLADIASRDAPMTTNERGGSQSHIPVRFDLIDGKAMFEMAKVLHEGAEKYGVDNWRLIPIEDHLNHLLMHTFAYLAGDHSDEHLSHILCRATFAQGLSLQDDPTEKPSDSLSEYLDSVIHYWRDKRDANLDDAFLRRMADHYIDAYQSVRISMLGETLD